MITKFQFDYLKNTYEDELKREDSLNKKAQIYLSICSFILTALFFKVEDLKTVISLNPSNLIKYSLIIVYFLVFITLIMIIMSLNIYKYQKPSDLNAIVDEFDNEIKDQEFTKKRSVDFIVATNHNHKINNLKAKYLNIALYILIAGKCGALVFLILLINGK